MAKVQCYNCKKVTPVVAPGYRCKFCNYPLNKYLEQEEEPEEDVIIEKIKQAEPDEPSIHDLYRVDQAKEKEVPAAAVKVDEALIKQLKPDEKLKRTSTGSVILKKNKNPEKDGKIIAGWLVVHTENKLSVTYELFEGENVIGRPDGPHHVDIRIEDDEYVSRIHAIIHIDKDFLHRFHYQLLDDGNLRNGNPSTNGTYVNGISERLAKTKMVFLRDGDTIQIGTTKVVFKNTDEANDDISAVSSVNNTDYTETISIRG